MKKLSVCTLALALGLAFPLLALDVSGVNVADTMTVEGKTLKLNGAGLRKKAMFKVYVAALYVENPSKDAGALTSTDQIRSMRLHFLRDVKGQAVTDAIKEGFERNSKAQLPALADRLAKFSSMVPNVAEGDDMVMTYVPGKGTVVSVKGLEKGTIEGKDFADALFTVWLGADPVQENLKADLLKG
jgi:hypothetical protein